VLPATIYFIATTGGSALNVCAFSGATPLRCGWRTLHTLTLCRCRSHLVGHIPALAVACLFSLDIAGSSATPHCCPGRLQRARRASPYLQRPYLLKTLPHIHHPHTTSTRTATAHRTTTLSVWFVHRRGLRDANLCQRAGNGLLVPSWDVQHLKRRRACHFLQRSARYFLSNRLNRLLVNTALPTPTRSTCERRHRSTRQRRDATCLRTSAPPTTHEQMAVYADIITHHSTWCRRRSLTVGNA